jgi:hypothetical protein
MTVKQRLAEVFERYENKLNHDDELNRINCSQYKEKCIQEIRLGFADQLIQIIREKVEGMRKDETEISGMWMELQRRIGHNDCIDEILRGLDE